MDDLGGCFQVFDDVIRFDCPFAHIAAVFAALEHKNGFTAGIVTGLDIAFSISDEKSLLGMADGFIEGFKGLF